MSKEALQAAAKQGDHCELQESVRVHKNRLPVGASTQAELFSFIGGRIMI